MAGPARIAAGAAYNSGLPVHIMSQVNLTNHFLIAMPAMADPNFSGTVTYICEHSPNGALGLVVNRASDLTMGHLFKQVGLELADQSLAASPVLAGGPVRPDCGFVLHRPRGQWSSTLKVNERLALTTSRDILEAIGRGDGPQQQIVTLGYSGWSAGQLEQEILQNAWLTVEATGAVLFDVALELRFQAALDLLGISLAHLSAQAGHA